MSYDNDNNTNNYDNNNKNDSNKIKIIHLKEPINSLLAIIIPR